MAIYSDVLLTPVGGVMTAWQNVWVRLVNNDSLVAYVSDAATPSGPTSTGRFVFSTKPPGGSYTVYTGPTNTGAWTATGETGRVIGYGEGDHIVGSDFTANPISPYLSSAAAGTVDNELHVAVPTGVAATDTSVVQTALTNGTGKTILLQPGTYVCNAVLNATANCVIRGAGMGVTTISFPTNAAASNLRLEVNQVSNVTIEDLTLKETGVAARTGSYGLLRVTGVTGADAKGTLPKNIRVSRVECDGGSGTGVFFGYVSDGVVSDCFVHNCWADGIHIQRGCTDIIVSNNDCENNGDDDIAFVSHNPTTFGHVIAVVAANNRLGDQNASLNLGAGITFSGVIGGVATGNLIRNTRAAGINLKDQDDTGSGQGRTMCGRIVVVGNEIYNSGLGGVGNQDSIAFGNCREVLIADNVGFSPNRHGIYGAGAMIDVSIRGNRIRNAITGRGIDVEPTNSADANVLTLWTDALLTDGESKANVCGHRINVQDNSIGTTSLDGIYLLAPAANHFDGLVCTGNEVWNTNKSNTGSTRGVFVRYADNVKADGNQVRAGYAGNVIQPIVLLDITKTGMPDFPTDTLSISDAADLVNGVDLTVNQRFRTTLGANRVVGAPFFPVNAMVITFIFTQDGTGGRTLTWNAIWKTTWQPAPAANAISSVSFMYDGTNWQQLGPANALDHLGTTTIGNGQRLATFQTTAPTVGSGGTGTSALSILTNSTNTSGRFQVTLTAVAPGVVAGVVAFNGGPLATAPVNVVCSLSAPTAGVAAPPVIGADTYTTSGFTVRVYGPTTVTTGTYVINYWVTF